MLLDAPLRSGPCRASYCAPPRQTPAPPNNRPGARSFLFFAEIVPVRNFLIEPRGFPVAPARLRLSRCFRQHPNCEGCHYWPGDMVWIPTNPLSYRTFPESGTRHKKSIGYPSARADPLLVARFFDPGLTIMRRVATIPDWMTGQLRTVFQSCMRDIIAKGAALPGLPVVQPPFAPSLLRPDKPPACSRPISYRALQVRVRGRPRYWSSVPCPSTAGQHLGKHRRRLRPLPLEQPQRS